MKFYDKETELQPLRDIDNRAYRSAQFTTLIGRLRTGKNTLMTHKCDRSVQFTFSSPQSLLVAAQFHIFCPF